MAIDSCEPCSCIRGRIDEDTYRQGVHIILCEILTALTGGTADTNVNVAEIGGVAVTVAGLGIHAEDSAHVSGSAGVFSLAVQQSASAPITFGGGPGDYTPFGVSSVGEQYVAMDARLNSGANTLLKFQDSAAGATDAGASLLFARRDSAVTLTTTNGDYTIPASNEYGAVRVDLHAGFQPSPANSPMRFEDAIFSTGNAVMMAGQVRYDTPSADNADSDVTPVKCNDVGATYAEPANKLATWVASETAGAAGGVPAAGVSILTNSAKLKAVRVYNTLNLPVQISLDAGTTWVMTAAATTGQAEYNMAQNGRWSAANVHARTIGGDSGSGTLYFSAMI